MARSESVQQAFNLIEGMKGLRGYPYGKDATHRLVQSLLKAADNDVDQLEAAIEHFQASDDPRVPTANQVRQFLYVEMRQMEAKERLAALKEGEECETCENDGRYIKELWARDPLKPGRPADPERDRPAKPQGRRWASCVVFCHCAIGKIRANLHELWKEHLKKSE